MESTEQVNRDAAIPDPDEPLLSLEDRVAHLERRLTEVESRVAAPDSGLVPPGLDVKV